LETSQIFEYKSDWVQYFEGYLKNEYKEEDSNKNLIKSHIVESNYNSIKTFANKFNDIELVNSKEDNFFNVKIKGVSREPHLLYLDISNSRFWVLHNIEPQKIIKNKIEEIFCNSYLQDKIYLPNQVLEEYRKKGNTDSLGISLKFKQLFIEDEMKYEDDLSELKNVEEYIDYSLRLWPKRIRTMDFFLNNFKKIGLPINYNSLNFVFYDEFGDTLIKEDLYYDGRFTINRGKDFKYHLKFVDNIKEKYNSIIKTIEENRFDWENCKGNLFIIHFPKELKPQSVYNIIKCNHSIFKIFILFLFKKDDYYFYDCVDEHTGGTFTLQISKNKMYINLRPDSCGNIILRIFSNLQKHLSPATKLEIDNENFIIG